MGLILSYKQLLSNYNNKQKEKMQAILTSITPDHIKIFISLILVFLSIAKLSEIKDQKTNLKNSYEVDVKTNQARLTNNNSPIHNSNQNVASQMVNNQNVRQGYVHSCNVQMNMGGYSKNHHSNISQIKNGSTANGVESDRFQLSEPMTLGQFLKRKHEHSLSAIQNDPLLICMREFEQRIKKQHEMEIQQQIQRMPIQPNIEPVINQERYCFQTPKLNKIHDLQNKYSEKTQATNRSASNQLSNHSLSLTQSCHPHEMVVFQSESEQQKEKKHTIKKKAKVNFSFGRQLPFRNYNCHSQYGALMHSHRKPRLQQKQTKKKSK